LCEEKKRRKILTRRRGKDKVPKGLNSLPLPSILSFLCEEKRRRFSNEEDEERKFTKNTTIEPFTIEQ
jgi:hypothetical protein